MNSVAQLNMQRLRSLGALRCLFSAALLSRIFGGVHQEVSWFPTLSGIRLTRPTSPMGILLKA